MVHSPGNNLPAPREEEIHITIVRQATPDAEARLRAALDLLLSEQDVIDYLLKVQSRPEVGETGHPSKGPQT